jgi:hypothetical protein
VTEGARLAGRSRLRPRECRGDGDVLRALGLLLWVTARGGADALPPASGLRHAHAPAPSGHRGCSCCPPCPPHPVSHSDGVLRREREGGGGGGLEPDRVHVAHAWGNHNGEG